MSTTELFQRQPENELDPVTGAAVVGFGYGLRDVSTGAPLPPGDPSLPQRGVHVVDMIALDQYPHAMRDPSFDPGHVLALVPDHGQGGAVGVWNEARQIQVGWLPGTAATIVNETLARGWSQHAVSLWAQRTPDNARTGLRIAVSTDILPIGGHPGAPPPASAAPPPAETWAPTAPPADVRRGKGAVVAVIAVILAIVIVAALWFVFVRDGGEPEPTTTTREQTTTTREVTTRPTTSRRLPRRPLRPRSHRPLRPQNQPCRLEPCAR